MRLRYYRSFEWLNIQLTLSSSKYLNHSLTSLPPTRVPTFNLLRIIRAQNRLVQCPPSSTLLHEHPSVSFTKPQGGPHPLPLLVLFVPLFLPSHAIGSQSTLSSQVPRKRRRSLGGRAARARRTQLAAAWAGPASFFVLRNRHSTRQYREVG